MSQARNHTDLFIVTIVLSIAAGDLVMVVNSATLGRSGVLIVANNHVTAIVIRSFAIYLFNFFFGMTLLMKCGRSFSLSIQRKFLLW